MNKKERFKKIFQIFEKEQPDPVTELHYDNPYRLVVAVILSAQCTDIRVNKITPGFFKRFPDPQSLAVAKQSQVFSLIKSCSYPNNKSKNLIGMAQTLIDNFEGELPESVDELQQLPGVGRKTAHVIASVIYNQPVMAVDTHVFRVSARLGLTTNAKTPLQTELQLVKYIPKKKISKAHHWLILHGRYICKARKPLCENCSVTHLCLWFIKNRLG